MQRHQPADSGRNLARHEQSFEDQLYATLRSTPWWLVSIGAHAILILGMFMMEFSPPKNDPDSQFRASAKQDFSEMMKEDVLPVPEETRPIDQQETVIKDPLIKDTPMSDHDETDNELLTDESFGEKDFLSDAPFEGLSDNATIGIFGGAGGAYGHRGGNENLKAHGGGGGSQNAVDDGLRWLKNHQDPEGYWDSDGFHAQCKGNQCGGQGHALYDPGVTGLALLAFLGAGHTHRFGEHKATVRKGLRYLKQVQDPEGCFGPRTDGHFIYNHAIATLAMVEAYGMTGSTLFKQSAQDGIDFIHRAQNPYLAWRYGVRPQDNDTSVTGWMIMALKSARMAGLRVGETGFEGTRAWIEKVTEPEYGRVGYTERGSGPARPPNLRDRFPGDKSEALTAVGILSRIFVGEDPRKSEMIRKGSELLLRALPTWDETSGAIDMYYWYYGTLAMFQMGGDEWKTWNAAIKTAIIDHQRKDGDEDGSWDPVGPWGGEGGRVYSTAVSVMCMEVYYRYPRVSGTSR